MRKINISKEELDRMIFDEKLSYEEIGRKFNVCGTSIKKYAKKIGIILPKRRRVMSSETFNKGRTYSIEEKLSRNNRYKELYEKQNFINKLSDDEFLDFLKINKFNNVREIIIFLIEKKDNTSLRKVIRERCDKLGINSRKIQKFFIKTPSEEELKSLNNFSEECINNLIDDDCPGIYLIENNITNHKYIGQSVDLRKRLLWHLKESHWKTNVSNYPLYRAFRKYGIISFSFRILAKFNKADFNDLSELKQQLDYLEIKYIKEFDTYGGNGYNQTLGGDRGVLGYKMTEEQKAKAADASRKYALSGVYIVWYYDIESKTISSSKNTKVLGEILGINPVNLRRHGTIVNHRYITARTEEELKIYINKYNKGELYKKKK